MTLLWDVQAAVKALLTGALEVPVYDAGEMVGDDPGAYVTVGEAAENGDTATAEQTESPLGDPGWRDETGEIPCVVEVWEGGTDIAPLRLTARPLLDGCVAAVRADPTLGGLLPAPGTAQITSLRLREGQTDRGALVQAGFTVTYTALLT
jgi:hypothetical protein